MGAFADILKKKRDQIDVANAKAAAAIAERDTASADRDRLALQTVDQQAKIDALTAELAKPNLYLLDDADTAAIAAEQ